MDTNARESSDPKAEFRKPSTDAANRKYRRRSPVDRLSSSSDGSPRHDRSSSPISSRKDITKIADGKHKKDESRSSGRSGESYRHSDRQSSRSYHTHDDYGRRDKHVDDLDRGYSKSSHRSGRESRDYSRTDVEHRSRDYANDADTYYRTKSEGSGHKGRDKGSYDRAGSGSKRGNTDERDKDRDGQREDRSDRHRKADHRRTLGDYKKDHSPAYEESKDDRNNSSQRDNSGHRMKEASKRDSKELDAKGYTNDEKRKHDDQGLYKDQDNRQMQGYSDVSSIKGQDSVAKKSKFSGLESICSGADGSTGQAYVTDSDIDAAKVAAMKAAELVNKNLVGTGYMSTDQKKKLLWGSKKSTAAEEPAHRWDTTTFGDRERQEKFNKLMSLRLHWYLWAIVGREGGRKGGAEVGQSRCGETAGAAADGIRKAIHSWTAPERWSNCGARSVSKSFRCSNTYVGVYDMYFCVDRVISLDEETSL